MTAARAGNRLLPGEAGYLAALARYLRAAGDLAQAAVTARQAVAVAPNSADALLELGLCQAAAGDSTGARASFRQAQSAAPGDPRPYYHDGSLLLATGQTAAGRRALRQALRRNPDHGPAEDLLVSSLAGGRALPATALCQLLLFGRLNTVGLGILAFVYYVAFRLAQMLAWAVPEVWAPARVLLVAILIYLVLAVAGGRALRAWLRRAPA